MKAVFLEISSRSGPIVDLENWNLAKDGAEVCLLTNGVPIIDADGELRGYRGVDKDITNEKRREAEKIIIEERLRQAQKMEVIGTLAGGIAHDYNNLLAVIVGNLSLAKEEAEPHSVMAELLHEIEQAAYKAKGLTYQFLTLSKHGFRGAMAKPYHKNDLESALKKILE